MTTSVQPGSAVAKCTSTRLLRQRAEVLVNAGAIFHWRAIRAARPQPILRRLVDHALGEVRLESLQTQGQLSMEGLPLREVLLERLGPGRRGAPPLAPRGCAVPARRWRQLPDAAVGVTSAPEFVEIPLPQGTELARTLA